MLWLLLRHQQDTTNVSFMIIASVSILLFLFLAKTNFTFPQRIEFIGHLLEIILGLYSVYKLDFTEDEKPKPWLPLLCILFLICFFHWPKNKNMVYMLQLISISALFLNYGFTAVSMSLLCLESKKFHYQKYYFVIFGLLCCLCALIVPVVYDVKRGNEPVPFHLKPNHQICKEEIRLQDIVLLTGFAYDKNLMTNQRQRLYPNLKTKPFELGYIFEINNKTIVSIRGTASLRDLIDPLYLWSDAIVMLKSPWTLFSFWPQNAAVYFLEKIQLHKTNLDRNLNINASIYVGHSMGGVLGAIHAIKHKTMSYSLATLGLEYSLFKLNVKKQDLIRYNKNIVPERDLRKKTLT